MDMSPVHQVWPKPSCEEPRKGEEVKAEEVGIQRQGIDRPRVRQVLEGSGDEKEMEGTGYEVICGAPTILAASG